MSRSIDYNKLYKTYSKEYNRAELSKSVSGYGDKLYSEKLSKAEFKVSAKQMRKDGFQPQQIVNELVKEQKYQYSYKQGKLFKEAAEKYDFGMEDVSVHEFMEGLVDLSLINNLLKARGVSSGKERAKIIGEQFLGVDPITGESP